MNSLIDYVYDKLVDYQYRKLERQVALKRACTETIRYRCYFRNYMSGWCSGDVDWY